MRMWSKLMMAVVVAMVALAAPAGASAQYGPHKVAEVKPFSVATEDGKVLRGHVYLPDKQGPHATVLELSPYHDTAVSSPTASKAPDGKMTKLFRHFTEAGYAVAFVSMRGTGKSAGCLQLGSHLDRRDSYRVIEALADEPWSNGRIGMYGLSYAGWSQYLAMAANPPSLKAVVPMSGIIDLWSLISRRGAAYQIAGPVFSPTWTALTSLGTLDPAAVATEHAGCPNLVGDAVETLQLQFGAGRNAWWDERDQRADIKDSPIPALVTNGMSMLRQPLSVQEGHILQFEGLWNLLRHDRTRFLLGQWPHAYPNSDAKDRQDFPQMTLDFLDEHLRGTDRKLEQGVVEYQDDDKTWHTARSWPPPSEAKRLYIGGEKVTDDPQDVVASQRSLQSADHDPGLRVQPGNAEDGKPYFSPCGPTQVLYVSPPLAEDVHLAGEFDVDVTISSTLPGGHFSFFIHRTSGTATCPDDKALDTGRAMLDLQHWRVAGTPEPFPVAKATRLSFHSHPVAANLRKGERIVVAIGGGASELTADQMAPVITVHTGPGIEGSFTLPVESGALRFEPSAAPAPAPAATPPSAQGTPPAGDGPGGPPTPVPGANSPTGIVPTTPACVTDAGFRSVSAVRRGRGLRFSFARRVDRPVTVDVFQQSRGRRVVDNRLVARFTQKTRAFTWNGRSRRGGGRLASGQYFARLRIDAGPGVRDIRRITLQRRGGRFSARPAFYGRESCGLLRSTKLSSSVFGGTQGRRLGIAYRTTAPTARVTVTVLRGSRVIRRFPARISGSRTQRLTLVSRRLRRGDYRVRIEARDGARTERRTLTARRL